MRARKNLETRGRSGKTRESERPKVEIDTRGSRRFH
jgi:hypothetical protein